MSTSKRLPLLRAQRALDELPTTAKLVLVVTIALLPLGLIALVASLKASQSAAAIRTAEVTETARAAGNRLRGVILSDVAAMRRAANAATSSSIASDICTPLASTLAQGGRPAADYALYNGDGIIACRGLQKFPLAPQIRRTRSTAPDVQVTNDGFTINIPARRGAAIGVLSYSPALIASLIDEALPLGRYTVSLTTPSTALFVREDDPEPDAQPQSTRVAIGLPNVELTVVSFTTPAGFAQTLIAFLPLLMWASASVVTLFVFDRLLLRPLRRLQDAVMAHQPGMRFRLTAGFGSAREIRSLGNTIAGYIDQLETKEETLATALDEQRRATREVHHRVKNNIQVVASLISLHARTAKSKEASSAYATIQRRVDAMAIVHRNHYAELDSAYGLDLKTLLSEVATNLRASFPAPTPRIALAAMPVRASQDHALAIAFLATELAELAVMVDPNATIGFSVSAHEGSGQFSAESSAFAASPALVAQLESGYGRIVDGLVRQLRATLGRGSQSFSVTFTAIDPAASEPQRK